MISISADKKFSIILPNTNKALAEVLKNASPKELELITTGKDLKSIMNSLLKESSQNSGADKMLLELVKNNPTLKELGSVNENIKNLLSNLKSDKNLEPTLKLIQKFLPDIKELKNTNIKSTIENSGVFLESKLKNVQNPQIKLKNLLNELSTLLTKSKLPTAKVLATQVKELLSSESLKELSNNKVTHIKENHKVLESIAKRVQNIVDKFTTELKRANPITTKEFEAKLTKLEHILQPKNLEKENFTLLMLQDSLKQVTQTLQTSFTKESKGFLDALNKIFQSLKSIKQSQLPPKAVLEQIVVDKKIPTEIKNIIENIKSSIQNSDSLFSKPVKAIVNELTLLKSPHKLSNEQSIKELLSNDLKAVLHKTSDEMSKSTIPSHVEAAKQMDKLSLQIDYYQLVSHLSNSSSLYIPFNWEDMQEGNITIKKAQNDKFYCDIDLKLKEYGELKLRLIIYEKNQLNIHINSDNDEFKTIIKENIPSLRKALIDIQITPREIRFFNTKNSTITYDNDIRDLGMGFEVKV